MKTVLIDALVQCALTLTPYVSEALEHKTGAIHCVFLCAAGSGGQCRTPIPSREHSGCERKHAASRAAGHEAQTTQGKPLRAPCACCQTICHALQDLAFHAARPFPAGRALGVYRSMTMLPAEELVMRHNPPDAYPLSTAHWRQAVDAYAAELAPPAMRTWGKRLVKDVFDDALQVMHCPVLLS